MPISVKCSSCGKPLSAPDSVAGRRAKCPNCGAVVVVPEIIRPEVIHQPEEIATISVTCPACGKTLSAPESAAGRRAKCPGCGGVVVVGKVIHKPEVIDAQPSAPPQILMGELVMPVDAEPVVDDSTQPYSLAGHPNLPAAGQSPADQAGPPRRPCPMCGEEIVATAAKCHYCGTIFDPALKRQEEKRTKSSDKDASLSTGDWIFCILCAGIACIFGIVYAIQGKPKGMKMIGVAIVAAVVWNVISAIIQNAAR